MFCYAYDVCFLFCVLVIVSACKLATSGKDVRCVF